MKGQLAVQDKKKGPVLPASTFLQHAAVRPVADHTAQPEPAGALAESRFGQDFSQVAVHAGSDAARSEITPSCPLTPTRCPFGGACHTCPVRVQAKLAALNSFTLDDKATRQETIQKCDSIRTKKGLGIAVEANIQRPRSTLKAAVLSNTGEAERVEMEGDASVKMAQADGGVSTPATSPAAGTCTYAITYANIRTPGCGAGRCGAQIVYDVTKVTATGSGCPPSLAGLQLTESVTTDSGCIPGAVSTGAGCPIGAGGTITGCTDTYGLCASAASFPAAGCTERYTQKLSVGGVLAETRTITFRITRTGGACSGTVTRT
jgi:ferredoxin